MNGQRRWSLPGCLLAALFPLFPLFSPVPALAADDALPNPLTLDQALALADSLHPDVVLAQARLESARASARETDSGYGLRAYLDIVPQAVKPAADPGADSFVDDSRARLLIQKKLYDFGQTRARDDAAQAVILSREQGLLDARTQRRLEIMSRFFDVLLADLRFAVDTEAMAQFYVRFDQMRELNKSGRVSEVDLLEAEHAYQEARAKRFASQAAQTATRQRLALALNRPDQLPTDLVKPVFAGNDRVPPDFRAAIQAALAASPVVVAQRKEVEAAQSRVSAERARRRPVLSAEAEAAAYQREFSSRDAVRGTLTLRIPLYQGGEDRAAIDQAHARLDEQKALLARSEHELRARVLELVQEIETLRAEREAAKVRRSYRELYLDRSRSMYELEMRSTLGDAMTRQSESDLITAQVEYRLALAWAKLEALGGIPPPAATEPAK